MIPRRLELPLAVAVGIVMRVPFWVEALRTPVDGDTAIIGLMARHPLRSTTMWGQPYGSPVEAWLAAPLLALLQPDTATLRLAYFLLGLGLIPAAYFLARALDERAALPAAVLMACPSPYFLLLASLPPPMYPVRAAAVAPQSSSWDSISGRRLRRVSWPWPPGAHWPGSRSGRIS